MYNEEKQTRLIRMMFDAKERVRERKQHRKLIKQNLKQARKKHKKIKTKFLNGDADIQDVCNSLNEINHWKNELNNTR